MTVRAIFLRGVNLGAHRRFKNASIVEALAPLQVKPVGAAGTFVVAGSMPDKTLRARINDGLGFDADAAIRPAKEITALIAADPFARFDGWLPFVSVLCSPATRKPKFPIEIDPDSAVIGIDGAFVLSVRRKGAAYPDVDELFGAVGTTRGWPTILRVAAAIDAV